MATINIPESDAIAYKDFIAGHPVHVKAVSSESNEHDFDKGCKVNVSHLNMEAEAQIVSDPLELSDQAGKKVFSLVVEKCK